MGVLGFVTRPEWAAMQNARRRKWRLSTSIVPNPDADIAALYANSEQGAWYDPSDLTTLFQDAAGTTPVTADGQSVGMVKDKSGNGNDLTQATATARPIYKTDGTLHWLEGDGVDDFLRSSFTITQPWDRISALRQLTWTSSRRIFSGVTTGYCELYQRTTNPETAMYAGGTPISLIGPVVGEDQIYEERYSGASSRGSINGGEYVTGDVGSGNTGGLTIFSDQLDARNSSIRLYGLVMREGQMTDEQIAQARQWLATKSGVTL